MEGVHKYTVLLPLPGTRLFRLAERMDETAFLSNRDLNKPRFRKEDAAMYTGFSALASERHARAYVAAFDFARARGGPPRWNVILEFELDPGEGHVCADTRGEGHFTVWGDRFKTLRGIPI